MAKDGQIVFKNGYGLANESKRVPVTPDTVFDIGSISKQFTAAAVLKLEAQGLLNVRDPISKFLDRVPADKTKITFHQLLTHSAGLAEDHSSGDLVPMTRSEALQTIFSQLLVEPYQARNTPIPILAILCLRQLLNRFPVNHS